MVLFRCRRHVRLLSGNTQNNDPMFYSVLHTDGAIAGIVSYLRITPPAYSIEIGHIWHAAARQRGAPTLRRFFCWRKTPSLWAIVGWNGNATPAISAPDWPPCGWVSPLRAFFANARLVKGKTATRLGLPSLTATGRPYGIISAAGWRQKTARFRWPRPTARWLLGLYRRTILAGINATAFRLYNLFPHGNGCRNNRLPD